VALGFAFVFVALAIFSATVIGKQLDGDKVGVKVAVSEDALLYMKDQMLPYAEKSALSAVIPDLTEQASIPVVGKVDLTLKNIKLNRLALNKSYVELEAGNKIGVIFSGLSMDVTLNWHYREERFPHLSDSGRGEASTRTSSGSIDVIVGADKDGRPTAVFDSCSLNLHDLSIHLSGGASWLYNAVVSLFHKKITNALQTAICGALHGDLQDKIDELLSTIPVQEPVGNYFAIDYSLAGPHAIQIVPEKSLVACSSGEFFPIGGKPGGAPGTPAEMPNSLTNNQFQIFVSEFSIESLGYAAVKDNLAQRLITKDIAPPVAAYFFSTDFYSEYAPGLITKYGEGKEVSIFINMCEAPDLVLTEVNEIYVKANVDVTIRVKNDAGTFEDAFTLLLSCVVDANANVENNRITGLLTDAGATASLVSSNVGDIDINGFNDLVQFALSMGLDSINDILKKGAPLPVMPGLTFVNPKILYHDGYILVATNITYTPPN